MTQVIKYAVITKDATRRKSKHIPLKTPPRMLHEKTSISVQFTPQWQDVVFSTIYSWPALNVSSWRNLNIMQWAECYWHTSINSLTCNFLEWSLSQYQLHIIHKEILTLIMINKIRSLSHVNHVQCILKNANCTVHIISLYSCNILPHTQHQHNQHWHMPTVAAYSVTLCLEQG